MLMPLPKTNKHTHSEHREHTGGSSAIPALGTWEITVELLGSELEPVEDTESQ